MLMAFSLPSYRCGEKGVTQMLRPHALVVSPPRAGTDKASNVLAEGVDVLARSGKHVDAAVQRRGPSWGRAKASVDGRVQAKHSAIRVQDNNTILAGRHVLDVCRYGTAPRSKA